MATAPAAVIASPSTRPGATTLVVSGIVIGVSMAAFSAVQGVQSRWFDSAPEVPAASTAVDRVVGQQQDLGRTCRTEPAATDHVVFQHAVGDAAQSPRVEVLGLADAVAAVRAGMGSIQSYCI